MKSVLLYPHLGLEGGAKVKSIPLYLDQSGPRKGDSSVSAPQIGGMHKGV